MVRSDGATRGGNDSYLDPGHPTRPSTHPHVHVVENYPVDGIHFDRVRYPDQNVTAEPAHLGLQPDRPRALAAETGRTDRRLPPIPCGPSGGATR
jgi:uncharacterized lipoprotein YddW (UPF0748 family)